MPEQENEVPVWVLIQFLNEEEDQEGEKWVKFSSEEDHENCQVDYYDSIHALLPSHWIIADPESQLEPNRIVFDEPMGVTILDATGLQY